MAQTKPSFTDAPKISGIKVAQCTRSDGKANHSYVDGVCKFCGFQNPYKQRTSREKGPARPSPIAVSQTKARAIIFGTGSLAQRLVLQLIEEEHREEFSKDALSAEELLLLSDALADEAVRSKRIVAWLAALDKIGPHAKLGAVITIIALPRLARHGMIPEELAVEFGNAAAATLAMASGPSRDDNRGDLRGQVDFSGGGPVTTPPIPAGEPEQNGSGPAPGQVPGGGRQQEPFDFTQREIQPDRAETQPTDSGESSEGVLPGAPAGVAPRGMDRIRRRRVVP